jgi:DGQHR domain-containing protein
LTRYYVYRVDYGEGKTLQSGWIKLSTKKMKDKINIGDKFLVYIKNKGILATGFSVREVDDNKPYNAKINLLPSFMSDFKPNDKSLEKRGKFLEISEENYNTFKKSMEHSKVNDYSDLKNQAQRKGEKFEEEIYNFFNDLFTPLSDYSEVKQKVYYETGDGKRTFETDVFIKFKDYDILCDAFINKGEIGRKINRFNDIYGSLDQSKRNYVRFILFYKDEEENLAFEKSNLNDKTFVFDKKAKLYYKYIFETTRLPNKKPKDEPTAIAAYHFLGELEVKITDQSLIATPYLKLNEGDNLLYIFKKDIKEITPLLYVARRERGKQKFYQRLLKRSKLNGSGSIDDYLGINNDRGNEREHTTFLNSIIISPEEIKESNDVIEIPFKYGSVAILDGQHRVYGAYLNALKVKKDVELYFTAIVDKNRGMLPIEAQQEYFISINMEQTKVDPEQIWRAYSELSSYKNKFNGIISQVAKEIEKDHILTIKKSIQHKENENEEKGVSFSGLCVNLEKLLTTTNLLDKNRPYPYTDVEKNKHVDVTVKSIKNLIEVIKGNFDEKDQKIFLRHDGYLSVIFRLYTKILSVNRNGLKSELIKPYFVALSDLLKVDNTLLNKIETSGEGPRKKSADLLASLINSRLPKGVNTLSVETSNPENPVVDSIATMLSKITTINLGKDEKGQDKYIIKHTGAWAEYGLKLNKPVTNDSEFVNNVINVLYQLLHEGGKNIPEKFKKNSVLEKINALRTYADHDISHGEKKDAEKKRTAAEGAVYSYLTIRKVPSELNGNQLEELKIKLLNEVNSFLIDLYNETNNTVLNTPQPSTT